MRFEVSEALWADKTASYKLRSRFAWQQTKVTLAPSASESRNNGNRAANQAFTLNTYNDNGVTVYSFDVEDPAYRQSAMDYINRLTGDPGISRGPLLPGQSEYHNDTKYDGREGDVN